MNHHQHHPSYSKRIWTDFKLLLLNTTFGQVCIQNIATWCGRSRIFFFKSNLIFYFLKIVELVQDLAMSLATAEVPPGWESLPQITVHPRQSCKLSSFPSFLYLQIAPHIYVWHPEVFALSTTPQHAPKVDLWHRVSCVRVCVRASLH